MEKLQTYSEISLVFNLSPGRSKAARSTEADSTQARGCAIRNGNAKKFSLDPIINRFQAPAGTVGLKSTIYDNHYYDRAVSMMANSMPDPSFCRHG